MKKICILLLILCFVFSGCSGNPDFPEESEQITSGKVTTGEAPRDENKISLIGSDGNAVYHIIYPENASPLLLEAAGNLRMSLYQLSGKKFDLSGDSAAAQDCEILIGSTNRGDSAVNIPLGTYDFIITVKGTKVIITGGSDYATAKALDETVSFLEGDQLLLEKDFRYIGNTETEPHLIALTNQSNGSIDVYDITTGVFDETTLLHRIKVGANNPAGVKLRRHETWGDVIITCYGANTGAILSYPEGKPLWTTYSAADNPHSVELLPGNIFVVASSSGNALRFFDLNSNVSVNAYIQVDLTDAHGVLWDPQNRLLWALSGNELVSYQVGRDASGKITVTEVTGSRIALPTQYGHDLAPYYGDTNLLWVTTAAQVYLYNKTSKTFTTTIKGIESDKRNDIKGIGNFHDGSLVLVRPDGVYKDWTTATVDFYIAYHGKYFHYAIKSQTEHFYKCRVLSADYQ